MKIETTLDLQDNRISNISNAIEPQDAVSLAQAQALLQPQAPASSVLELSESNLQDYLSGEAIDLTAQKCAVLVVNLVTNYTILLPNTISTLQVIMLTPYINFTSGILKTDDSSKSLSFWYRIGNEWIPIWLSNGVFNPVSAMNGGELGNIEESA
jgi:hypothetical protein